MSSIKYFTITDTYITLGQFLKEKSFISSGGQAKFYLKNNTVTLNGENEQLRGKKIFANDRLLVNGQEYEFRQED